ncbi:hypothetical protein FIBSPDRAFT_1036534 [Athelia psychrophila]|uniref:Uncharacterized protein n=1 Tax=Athelia psychrophila TaxID=1759441 RepID=A0A166VNT7_9AGAM|nr:hypothetical protein FIBSPDRAFT_1036534 [Fibularhizoctonia sp. CBS 109695]
MPHSRPSTSTNPFTSAGWVPPTGTSPHPREYLTGAPPEIVAQSQSYGALPLATSPAPSPSASPSTPGTLIRFVLRPAKNGLSINCAVLDHHDHVHYTVLTETPALTMVKNFERHSVGLIEWANTVPVVDIRGGRGKKPVDQWLIQDSNHPRTRLMQWKDAWYSWITDAELNELRLYQSQQGRPLAVVRLAGSMFEVEFAPNVLNNNFLEPCIVAIIIIKWHEGHFDSL